MTRAMASCQAAAVSAAEGHRATCWAAGPVAESWDEACGDLRPWLRWNPGWVNPVLVAGSRIQVGRLLSSVAAVRQGVTMAYRQGKGQDLKAASAWSKSRKLRFPKPCPEAATFPVCRGSAFATAEPGILVL